MLVRDVNYNFYPMNADERSIFVNLHKISLQQHKIIENFGS